VSFFLSLLAAALYSVSSALLWGTLSRPRLGSASAHDTPVATSPGDSDSAQARATDHRRMTLAFAAAAVVLHGWVVIHQTGLPRELALPLFTSMAATTLIIVMLHIILCLKQPADYLGIAVYPTAAITLIASQASGGGTQIIGDAVQIHVFLSLLAYAVLALAAAQAILVSIQRHYLSRHKPGGFMRTLPPLDLTERLLFTLLTAGFILLSMCLASGFFYLEDMFAQHLVHKTALSCIGWAIFGVLLFGRWQFGWRGKRAVHWTVAGFAILVLAYFGSKIVLEVFMT